MDKRITVNYRDIHGQLKLNRFKCTFSGPQNNMYMKFSFFGTRSYDQMTSIKIEI